MAVPRLVAEDQLSLFFSVTIVISLNDIVIVIVISIVIIAVIIRAIDISRIARELSIFN